MQRPSTPLDMHEEQHQRYRHHRPLRHHHWFLEQASNGPHHRQVQPPEALQRLGLSTIESGDVHSCSIHPTSTIVPVRVLLHHTHRSWLVRLDSLPRWRDLASATKLPTSVLHGLLMNPTTKHWKGTMIQRWVEPKKGGAPTMLHDRQNVPNLASSMLVGQRRRFHGLLVTRNTPFQRPVFRKQALIFDQAHRTP